MKVEQAKMNLLQKAKARPDQVRKVLETARNLGWRNALETEDPKESELRGKFRFGNFGQPQGRNVAHALDYGGTLMLLL